MIPRPGPGLATSALFAFASQSASAGSAGIDPATWMEGCAALTQPGPVAAIMDEGCTRSALQYCGYGRSDAASEPDVDACYSALTDWLVADMDHIAGDLPDAEQNERRIERDQFAQLTPPETCFLYPPLAGTAAAYCRAMMAGRQWAHWRDTHRRMTSPDD